MERLEFTMAEEPGKSLDKTLAITAVFKHVDAISGRAVGGVPEVVGATVISSSAKSNPIDPQLALYKQMVVEPPAPELKVTPLLCHNASSAIAGVV